jgi:hypothetical protein
VPRIGLDEYIDNLNIEVPTRLGSILTALTIELDYEDLVSFVLLIDQEIADSVFTDMLKAKVAEL